MYLLAILMSIPYISIILKPILILLLILLGFYYLPPAGFCETVCKSLGHFHYALGILPEDITGHVLSILFYTALSIIITLLYIWCCKTMEKNE